MWTLRFVLSWPSFQFVTVQSQIYWGLVYWKLCELVANSVHTTDTDKTNSLGLSVSALWTIGMWLHSTVHFHRPTDFPWVWRNYNQLTCEHRAEETIAFQLQTTTSLVLFVTSHIHLHMSSLMCTVNIGPSPHIRHFADIDMQYKPYESSSLPPSNTFEPIQNAL